MRIKYISQVQENECAYCCIAMLLSKYGDNSSINRLRQLNEIGRDGTSIVEIVEIFNNLEFDANVYQVFDVEILLNAKLPVIAYWNNNHFVVIEKIEKNYISIVDPNFGKKKITKKEFTSSFSNIIVEAVPKSTFIPQKNEKDKWRAYTDFFKSNGNEVRKLLAISIMYFASVLLIPYYINFMVDALAVKNTNFPIIALIGLITIGFFYGLILFIKNKVLVNFSVILDKEIYSVVINKIFSVSYSFFENRTTGDIVFRFNLLTMVRDTIVETISGGILNIGVIVLLMVYYFSQSMILGLILLVIILIIFFLLNIISKKSIEINQEEIQENSKLQSLQYETIFTMNTIKTADAQGDKKRQVAKQYNTFIEKYKDRSIVNGFYGVINNLVMTFGPIFILMFSYIFLSENETGKIFALYSVAGILFGSVTSSFNTYLSLKTVGNYIERINDILVQEDEQVNETGLSSEMRGEIKIKDLNFCYPGQKKNTLSNINLHIRQGESVALLGETGSGKSTLLKILSTLYKMDKETLFFDDIDMNEYNLIELRNQIGIIPQEIVVFNKSIKENITLGSEKFNDAAIIQAAKDSNIHDFILTLPMKYETIISEQGANFSGGQRQRIILARAFIRSPKILILDEATSSLDGLTESEIFKTISEKKMTRIIITHNRNIAKMVDTVIELENGEIIRN